MKLLGLATLVAALAVPPAAPQTRPDFSGAWEFVGSPEPSVLMHGGHGEAVRDDLCGVRCEIVQDGDVLKITPVLPRGETKLFPLDGVAYKRVRASQGAAPGVDYTAQAKWVDDNIEITIGQMEARAGEPRHVDTTYVLWHLTSGMTIEIAKSPDPGVKTSGMFTSRPSPSRLHYRKR